jgi:hypothetical protein
MMPSGDAVSDPAEYILFGNLTILEHQLAGIGAAHAELVELLGGGKTLESLLDQKGRDAACAGGRVGLGIDYQRLGLRAVGDPHLAAVENVAVALLFRARLHRNDVGAGAGLGHGEPAYVLARYQLAEIAAFLVVAAVAADLVDAQIRVRAIGKPNRGGGARDFFHRHAVLEIA